MSPVSIGFWSARLLIALVIVYSAWWVWDLDRSVLNMLKILMELLLPSLFGDIGSVMHSVDGGWKINTLLSPVGDPSRQMSFRIDSVFLFKSIVWIPAAAVLIVVSAKRRSRSILTGSTLILLAACSVVIVCVAAHLAVVVNNAPAVLDDDILPPPPGVVLSATAYPAWYFHGITFLHYLGMLVAPLMMPVIIWLLVCHREIMLLLHCRSAKSK